MSHIEIRRTLVLSTGHLTEALASAAVSGAFVFHTTTAYGWEAYVGEDLSDDEHDVTCVNAAFALARKHECSWVAWDQDGPQVSDLPVYDW